MGAPVVAGLAALVIAQDPSRTVAEVIQILKDSADDIDSVNPSYVGRLGAGRINAFRALSPPNTAPVITALSASPASILETATSTITATASDADGDGLSYAWGSSGGGVSGSGASVTFTPPDVAAQTVFEVWVSVSDGNGGSAADTVSVTVDAVNTAPVITALSAVPALILETATSTVTATASDADGDGLSYAWGSSGGGVSGSGASVTFTPPDVAVQTVFEVWVSVSDGNGGSAADTVSVTVDAVITGAVFTGPWP